MRYHLRFLWPEDLCQTKAKLRETKTQRQTRPRQLQFLKIKTKYNPTNKSTKI